MTSVTSGADIDLKVGPESPKPNLDHETSIQSVLLFLAILALGLGFTAYSIWRDVQETGAPVTTYLPFLLLGFEFVNGFHDTANAVATVIYTHALPANFAVIWSGFFNFLGVLFSTGAVA